MDFPSHSVPARLIIIDESQQTEHILDSDNYKLGRLPDCQICLDKPGVSRYHAQIRRDGLRYTLFDLKSKNGTFVNGRRLEEEEEYILNNNDVIGLGSKEDMLRFNDPDSTADMLGSLRYNRKLDQYILNGHLLHLTPNESRLLTYLYQHAGELCVYHNCVQAIWSSDQIDHLESFSRLHRIVSDLRRKFEAIDNDNRVKIESRSKYGYILIF